MTDHPVEPYPTEQQAPAGALYEAVVRGAEDAIMVLRTDGTVAVWNHGCERLFGWTAEEMLGSPLDAVLPEQARDVMSRVLRALDGRPEPAAVETVRLHRSGAVVPVSCRLSPVLDAGGAVVGVSAVVRDNSREIELRRQLEQTRHLAEARFTQSVVAQATLTPDGVLVDVNPALCRLSGYEAKQLLGRPVTDFLTDADRTTVLAELGSLACGDVPDSRRSLLLRHADGRFLETRVSAYGVRDEDSGVVLRLEVVVEDLSETAAAQRELRLREARWQSLAAHSADVALFADAGAVLRFATAAATSRFGYQPEEVVGTDGFSFYHPEDEPTARAVWARVAAEPGSSTTFEARVLHADGSWRWAELSLTNRLDDEDVGAMVVNLVDVSQRKAAEAVLEELAGLDALTGLATRAPLMAALDAAFAAGAASHTAVVVLDLVRLKLVNDAHGHRGGDAVLQEVARRLVDAVGERGVVARVGGDRFAVMLREAGSADDVHRVAGALREAVQRPLLVAGATLALSAAVGAALGPSADSGALLAAAEGALTSAKQDVDGSLHVVPAESASAAVVRARLVEDLRRGVDGDQLVVHFQPVLSLAHGRPVAAEALVRWLHPEKGLLSPGAFITAAEDSGLVVDVGRVVLREACRAAARWAWAGTRSRPFHVAVNLSARQLLAGDVVRTVEQALADAGAAPQNLVLEVTESAVMADVEAAAGALRSLRELGVAVAVDDFGTGYSSLTYLKEFPVSILKIDRSFVAGLGSDRADAAIVSSVLGLARAMDLECIAEGVETEQQRVVLQALGCGYGQGFLWSPAVDADAFAAWLGPAARGGSHASAGAAPVAAEDAALRERAAALHASGASLHTIAAALNAERLPTPQGKRWTATSVGLLLAGPTG